MFTESQTAAVKTVEHLFHVMATKKLRDPNAPTMCFVFCVCETTAGFLLVEKKSSRPEAGAVLNKTIEQSHKY